MDLRAVAGLSLLAAAAAACRGASREAGQAPPSIGYEQHVAAGGVAPVGATLANPFADDRASVAEGERTFVAMNCDGCHGILGNSSKKGITAAAIQVRMANPPYATRSLSVAEVQAVSAALAVTPTTPASAPLPGKAVYDGSCAGCHSLGSYDGAGLPNLSSKSTLVNGKFPTAGVAGHNGITLSATQRTDVAAFLNAN